MTAISFYVSAIVGLVAAVLAIVTRAPRRSIAGACVAMAAMIVPLTQLRAPLVAALTLLCAGIMAALLGGVLRLRSPDAPRPRGRTRANFWLPAGLGLAGFVWCLLASGSRQVIETPPPLERAHVDFGDGAFALEVLAGEHLVASSVVGLLALCCVIAAVVTLVSEGEARR